MCHLKLLMRRLLGLAAVAGIASLAIGPATIHWALHETLASAWEKVGGTVIDQDLASLAKHLGNVQADLGRAKSLREDLAGCLQGLEARRQDVEARAGTNRSMLEQIADLLRRHIDGPVIVDGRSYDRAIIERDGDRYLRLCLEDDDERAGLVSSIAALVTEIARVDRKIEAAERALQAKESDLAVLEAAVEAHRIRQELATLAAGSPWEARE